MRHGEDDIAPPQAQIDAQCEPFGRECRAFARLKEVEKEHLAVRCYGYMIFDKATEQILADKLGLDDWGRNAEDYPEFEGRPLQAIVKEFLPPPETAISEKDARRMIKDLKEIHQCGIVVYDIKYDAYIGPTLVDFSVAATVPHIQFDQRFGFNYDNYFLATSDLSRLDEDVFRWFNEVVRAGPRIWVRTQQPDYHLRKRHRSDQENNAYNEIPLKFDWRKCANEWTKLPRRSKRLRDSAAKDNRAPVKKRRRRKKLLQQTPYPLQALREPSSDFDWTELNAQ